MRKRHLWLRVSMGVLGVLGAACVVSDGELGDTSSDESAIVRGQLEPDARYPWVVTVNRCHGTLIHPRWVLTAGHCIADGPLVVTHSRLDPTTGLVVTEERSAAQRIKHPSYRPVTGRDIALVKLATPFVLGPLIQTAELPRGYQVMGQEGLIAARSHTASADERRGRFGVLRGSIVDVRCMASAPASFCVRSPTASACPGDSGSGFIAFDGTTPLVIGVTGWGAVPGQDCVNPGHPFGVASVFDNLEWIKQVTGLSGGAVADTFEDSAGWTTASTYATVQFANVDGLGKNDVCGRGADGIHCSTSEGGRWIRRSPWSAEFSTAAGWASPQYYSTIRFPDLNRDGRADVCGRGMYGVACGLSDGTRFGTVSVWASGFSDAARWNAEKYYSTIRFPDLNDDDQADVCGRGQYGITCALSTGTSFGAPTRWQEQYSDAEGWGLPQFYSTIEYPDLDADGHADICGRGGAGIFCALNDGTRFTDFRLWHGLFSDSGGWNNAKYYSTIRYPDLNADGKADVCARGVYGITCALSTGTSFGVETRWQDQYSDAEGWGLPQFYSTIEYPDVNHDGKPDICGRGGVGIFCAISDGTKFNGFSLRSSYFSDAGGWLSPQHYSTIDYVDVDADAEPELCGRGTTGVLCL